MTANRHELIDQLRTNVPQEMRHLVQWVVWRIEERSGKPTKVPYNPKNGDRANTTDSTTWASFNHACQVYSTGGYSGMGFVFSQHDPYVGVDFDDCISNGKIDPACLEYLRQLDSYTEFSQSGSGIHVIVRGALPERGRKSTAHKIEMYDHGRFFVMTGQHVVNRPLFINSRDDALWHLHSDLFGQHEPSASGAAKLALPPLNLDDQELLERMFGSKYGVQICSLWHGDISGHNNDHSAADLALCNHLAYCPLLVTAALTLITAWVQEGMPRYAEKRKGSYEAWTEVLGGILNTVNVAGFLGNEHEMYDAVSTETARLVEFVEAWYERYGEEEVRPKELFQLASKPDGPVPLGEVSQWRGLLDDILGAGNERSRRTKFGLMLDNNRDKVICGYKLVKNIRDKKRPRFSLHKLLKDK